MDFFIYSANGNFGVDVTSVSGHFRNVQINANVKVAKYKYLDLNLFIVVNGEYSQERIDSWLQSKLNPLPVNWKILTTANFILEMNKLTPLTLA